MSGGSVWNPENIKDVAESVGISNLAADVVDHLTRDVEFRLAQVLEEALKFMRHSKRTELHTSDISYALRALDVEPLYGYESTRPLKFGEASIGPGQPLYYLDDEEVDFEKLINAPLPKVPRDMTFTAHWLAIEGVQPTIPQNPAPAEAARSTDLVPKGPGANQHLSATAGNDVAVRPQVKHVLSKEMQLYFDHVCQALLDESNEEYRLAALSSLKSDPGLHQLVPYFINFVAEKVTHNLKSLFILTQMLHLIASLLENPHLHLAPYIASMIPPVLTCLIGKRLGPANAPLDGPRPAHYALRDHAASIMLVLTKHKFTETTPSLKPRLARTLVKSFLSTTPQPMGTYYGSILGLCGIAHGEGVRQLLLPNLRALDAVLKDEQAKGAAGVDELRAARQAEIETVLRAIVYAVELVAKETLTRVGDAMDVDGDTAALADRVGEVIAGTIVQTGDPALARAVLAVDATA